MTIAEFIIRQQHISELSEKCGNIEKNIDEIIEICKNAGITEDNMKQINATLSKIRSLCYNTGSELHQYALLMQDIANNTKIAWPPACKS